MDRKELKERLFRLRDGLVSGLFERDTPIQLGLLAAVAGEHLLLIGPPGTAKSLISQRLHLAFSGTEYFERLLTRFSLPEELFGPLSIKELEQDRYYRKTEKYLPQASIAFIDEIFKANSAILNSLLTLLNERKFDNGTTREDCLLISVIGASNEIPREGEEIQILGALFDRFLIRYYIPPVSESGFESLLRLCGQPKASIREQDRLAIEEIREIQARAEEIELSPAVVVLLKKLRVFLTQRGIYCSDRRWRKIVRLLKVAAWTNGQDEVSIFDAWLIPHLAWDLPEQHPDLENWYFRSAFLEEKQEPEHFAAYVRTWEEEVLGCSKDPVVPEEKDEKPEDDGAGENGATANPRKTVRRKNPVMNGKAALKEIRRISQDIQIAEEHLRQCRESMNEEACRHLWLPADFAQKAWLTLKGNHDRFRSLLARMEEVEIVLGG